MLNPAHDQCVHVQYQLSNVKTYLKMQKGKNTLKVKEKKLKKKKGRDSVSTLKIRTSTGVKWTEFR